MILNRCPAANDTPDNGQWIWEKSPGDETGEKQHSMGWDCAFVGALYNKMRVKKPLVDELFDKFRKYVDPTDGCLTHVNQALQLAEVENELAKRALDEAERGLKSANDFINGEYTRLRNEQVATFNSLTGQLNDLVRREATLANQALDLRNQAATLPDQIVEKHVEEGCEQVHKWLGPVGEFCKKVTNWVTVANRAQQDLLDQATAIENEATNLRENTIVATNNKINEANKTIADLDARFQETQKKIADKTLETAVKVARTALELKGKALDEARKRVAEIGRIDARAKESLAVWKNDESTEYTMVGPAEIPPPKTETAVTPPADSEGKWMVVIASAWDPDTANNIANTANMRFQKSGSKLVA